MRLIRLIFILLLICSVVNSYSQTRFSYVANPRISWFNSSTSDTEPDGSMVGFNTGLITDFFFAENYAFSTGITICQSGGKLVYADSILMDTEDENLFIPGGTQIAYRFRYVGVPVGLKFKTIEIGYSTFWLNLGLMPMVNIGAKASTDDEILDNANVKKESGMLNMEYFVKAGVEYSLGGETALVGGLGFNSGFIDVTKNKKDNVSTKSIALILGILF